MIVLRMRLCSTKCKWPLYLTLQRYKEPLNSAGICVFNVSSNLIFRGSRCITGDWNLNLIDIRSFAIHASITLSKFY